MLAKNPLLTVAVLSVQLCYTVSAQEYGPGLSDYVLVNDYEPSNFFDQFDFIVVSFVTGCTTVLAAKTKTDQGICRATILKPRMVSSSESVLPLICDIYQHGADMWTKRQPRVKDSSQAVLPMSG
jgi:hypothetical protein